MSFNFSKVNKINKAIDLADYNVEDVKVALSKLSPAYKYTSKKADPAIVEFLYRAVKDGQLQLFMLHQYANGQSVEEKCVTPFDNVPIIRDSSVYTISRNKLNVELYNKQYEVPCMNGYMDYESSKLPIRSKPFDIFSAEVSIDFASTVVVTNGEVKASCGEGLPSNLAPYNPQTMAMVAKDHVEKGLTFGTVQLSGNAMASHVYNSIVAARLADKLDLLEKTSIADPKRVKDTAKYDEIESEDGSTHNVRVMRGGLPNLRPDVSECEDSSFFKTVRTNLVVMGGADAAARMSQCYYDGVPLSHETRDMINTCSPLLKVAKRIHDHIATEKLQYNNGRYSKPIIFTFSKSSKHNEEEEEELKDEEIRECSEKAATHFQFSKDGPRIKIKHFEDEQNEDSFTGEGLRDHRGMHPYFNGIFYIDTTNSAYIDFIKAQFDKRFPGEFALAFNVSAGTVSPSEITNPILPRAGGTPVYKVIPKKLPTWLKGAVFYDIHQLNSMLTKRFDQTLGRADAAYNEYFDSVETSDYFGILKPVTMAVAICHLKKPDYFTMVTEGSYDGSAIIHNFSSLGDLDLPTYKKIIYSLCVHRCTYMYHRVAYLDMKDDYSKEYGFRVELLPDQSKTFYKISKIQNAADAPYDLLSVKNVISKDLSERMRIKKQIPIEKHSDAADKLKSSSKKVPMLDPKNGLKKSSDIKRRVKPEVKTKEPQDARPRGVLMTRMASALSKEKNKSAEKEDDYGGPQYEYEIDEASEDTTSDDNDEGHTLDM